MPRVPGVGGVAATTGRRVFLARTAMCAGGMLCLGCSRATAGQQPPATPAQASKFDADSKMTFKQVWQFAYGGDIPMLKALGDQIGREKFLPMLQEAASKAAAEGMKRSAPPPPKNTLAAFTSGMKSNEYFWSHAITLKWVEETERAAEVRVTECLWAQTFRAADAADIGYGMICHPDFAAATAFNPKMHMQRTKTLMQGHEYCNHRWVVEV